MPDSSTEAEAPRGVVFPETEGRRSTAATGRSVVSAALQHVDPVGARAATQESNWRRGYIAHFRRLVEAGVLAGQHEVQIASDGLARLHTSMEYATAEGVGALSDVFAGDEDDEPLGTATVTGTGEPERGLSVPYRGGRLRGSALLRQLDTWVEAGVVEPSMRDAVRAVVDHPEWLDLSGRRVVVLGAGAEMGPLQSLLRWGADLVAVDLPRPRLWEPILSMAAQQAGTVTIPTHRTDGDLPAAAGADLLHDLPRVADWLDAFDDPLVLGNYVYADGAVNVRVSTAVDVLSARLVASRPDTALAFLATPTDAFVVPPEVVAFATQAYATRTVSNVLRRPAQLLSGGRLLQPHYVPGSDPGICDSLVPQQGPNYALAKRLQRWRATVARDRGTTVSINVAPPTRTRSVLKNRALAAAYTGSHRFGVRVLDPSTSNTLMAALLVHDLCAGSSRYDAPWKHEADGAAHGGLWRAAYDPRSALGLAVLLGVGGARG